MYTIGAVKQHLIGMGHSGTLSRVRNFEQMCERAAMTMLTKVKPLELVYLAELPQAVHDQVYDYSLQSYFGSLIDIYPVDNRNSTDDASRIYAETFDRRKGIDQNKVSIEANQGVKFIRIDWPVNAPTVVNTMDSLTANGTWSSVGTAANLKVDTLRKISGSGSIEFDVLASGDGIKNSTMTQLDLSSLDGEGAFFAWVYLPSVTAVTSISLKWGNDLTLRYWTSAAQTIQADGAAFVAGWNLVKFLWSNATETGVVDDTTIDSAEIILATTGALAHVRVDNITVSLGRYFDIKAYSKYLFQDTSGNWESQPTVNSDDDVVVLDADAYQIFLMELLIAMAQQVEGSDSSFDIQFAEKALYGDSQSSTTKGRIGLYRLYEGDQPDQRKKVSAGFYNNSGNVSRGRW